ncbi:DsbA family protein [Rhizobium halophytocola]|uniref:Protein-disulfide isomerase n=1 Tax=Rhizobium halophytocola TaxID=735519 RepID=A0ABS4DXY4_9HYPH|nr:DsbA family protein [Rhizobium halophytocola]MBP1850559.1 protein-disulfide isomerase [Rhizobium halophytocola]
MTTKAAKIAILAGIALVGWTVAATAIVVGLKSDGRQQVAAVEDAPSFGEQVRAYLLANPEVMVDVQQALQKKQASAQQAQASSVIEKNEAALYHASSDISLGNPDGDVTIVEFFDYNCGYCKRALSDMDKVIRDDSKVRFVLKEFPILGEDSVAAHKVSDAFRKLAPEKYADFHRALLGGDGRATEASAIQLAAALGVDETAIRKEMTDNPNDASVRQAYQLATDLGVTGTPSYVIGGEAIFGAYGVDVLEQKIANVRACGKASC